MWGSAQPWLQYSRVNIPRYRVDRRLERPQGRRENNNKGKNHTPASNSASDVQDAALLVELRNSSVIFIKNKKKYSFLVRDIVHLSSISQWRIDNGHNFKEEITLKLRD
jgi:hypothetical protein